MADGDRKAGLAWQAKQNWGELKDDFFETRNGDGTFAYQTIKEFASKRWPLPKGKKSMDTGINMPVVWFQISVGPRERPPMEWFGDWQLERIIGEERFSKFAVELKNKINSEMDMLEAGRTLASSYIPLQEKVFNVLRTVEQQLNGTIFLDAKKAKTKSERQQLETRNNARMRMYTKTLEWVVDMKSKIDNQCLKMLGWDRPQFLAHFEQLRIEARKNGELKTVDGSVNRILAQLAVDQIEKSRMYELPLPDDVQSASEKIRKVQSH